MHQEQQPSPRRQQPGRGTRFAAVTALGNLGPEVVKTLVKLELGGQKWLDLDVMWV